MAILVPELILLELDFKVIAPTNKLPFYHGAHRMPMVKKETVDRQGKAEDGQANPSSAVQKAKTNKVR